MKKILPLLTMISTMFTLLSCGPTNTTNSTSILTSEVETSEVHPEVDQEIKRTFNYFKHTTNLTKDSLGYGLVLDRLTNRNNCSIAATGFAIAGYPIYVEENLMSKQDAEQIVSLTFDTILRMQADKSVSYEGCLSHFVTFKTAKRVQNSEISTIDTALLVSGAIVAGEYFGGEILNKALKIWGNVNFNAFKVKVKGKEHISMGVKNPNTNPVEQISSWSGYAEHLCIYLLGAGNPNKANRISPQIYDNMSKPVSSYGQHEHVYSWFGSLFTYQFSHAFFNFNPYKDKDGINWHDNSVEASLSAYEYCQDYAEYYKSYNENSWGLTACDTPLGYSGLLGTPPRGYTPDERYMKIAGTISPCAAIGSMPFTPELSLRALKYYQSIETLNDQTFGLRDAFNLDFNGNKWIDPDFIGIDKGISLLMLYNYKADNFLSNLGGNNQYIKEAFTLNGFTKVGA